MYVILRIRSLHNEILHLEGKERKIFKKVALSWSHSNVILGMMQYRNYEMREKSDDER